MGVAQFLSWIMRLEVLCNTLPTENSFSMLIVVGGSAEIFCQRILQAD